jgi:hypothetical protein
MSRIQLRAAALVTTFAVTACAGLKDALTAHVDLVARAGSQELSTQRLVQMMTAAGVPPKKEVAVAISNLWINYQLLGQAGAKGDTIGDNRAVDDAMWAQIAQLKSKKFYENVAKSFPAVDASTFEAKYNDGAMLAARHILFMAQAGQMKPTQIDSVKREAEKVRKMVNATNFAEMAKKYSKDGSAAQGGDLGVFAKGAMVPEFEKGLVALKPGEVSGLVQSPFGFHIIKRETWAEAKDKFTATYGKGANQAAESTFLANMEKGAAVEVKPNAAKTVKALAEDIDGYREDKSVIATSRSGDLTAAKLAKWIAAFPPQARIREQITQAPDSAIPYFVKNVMRNDMVLRAADSAKVQLDTAEVNNIRRAFHSSLMGAMNSLRVSPAALADSAKTTSEKERLAAARVEAYLDLLLKNQAQFVDVSEPVSSALRKKFEARVVTAGVVRAVAEAEKAKAKADSAKAAAMPSTVVPMPGAPVPAPAPKADTAKPAAKPAAKKP